MSTLIPKGPPRIVTRLNRLFLCLLIGFSFSPVPPAEAGFFSIPSVRIKGGTKLKKGRNKVKVVCRDDIGLARITYRAPGRKRTILPGGIRRQVIVIRFRTSKRRAPVTVTVFNTGGTRGFAKKILRRT